MKKILFAIAVTTLFLRTPVYADVLLTPSEQIKSVMQSKKNLAQLQLAKISLYNPFIDFKTKILTALKYKELTENAIQLINSGNNLNIKNEKGESLLYIALKMQNEAIVQALIQNGVDVNKKDKDGNTPLHFLINQYDVDWALLFQNHEDPVVDITDKLTSLLIKNGADVNAKDNTGKTPLHIACKSKNVDVIRFLLKNGADVNAKDNTGKTPLFYKDNDGEPPLFYVQDKEIAKLLIENGADVNIKDNDGNAPLHFLIKYKYHSFYIIELIKLLVKNGADINIKDKDGKTPLFYVKDKETTKLLIKNGADVNIKDNDGKTPFDYIKKEEIKNLFKQYIK